MAQDVQKLKVEIIAAIETLSPESLKLLSEFVDFLRFKRVQSSEEQSPQIPPSPESDNAWALLESLTGTIQAPHDWAAEHDHYLYETPKHSAE